MNPNLELLLAFFLFASIIVAWAFLYNQFLGPLIFTYRITNRDIRIIFLGFIPVWRVKWVNVLEIREIRWRDWFKLGFREMINTQNFKNRFWGHKVLIRRKRGFFMRNLLISPEKPKEFVTLCKQALGNGEGNPEVEQL